jgi:glycerol-3-phosphate dehydrogenase
MDTLATPISDKDVVWTYSGVRPLYDDGASSATAATRDYVLEMDQSRGAPALNVFGGKITTYRRLAESALQEVGTVFPKLGTPWTAGVPLPGGDFPVDGVAALVADLRAAHPFLSEAWALRLVRAYGTEARTLLAGVERVGDLGQDFGATLTEREVAWLMDREYAQTAEDVVWRRSKLGLRMSAEEIAALETWMQDRRRAERHAAAE